jgi:hypothetical protein
VDVPEPAADALLKGERHNTTFVGYLRLAFRWGGFPGWEGQPSRPERELAFLTVGIAPALARDRFPAGQTNLLPTEGQQTWMDAQKSR